MIAAATWIAVPLAALTTVSTICGGLVAVRARRELETLIALTGGIVVAVALFDVLPEAFDAVGNSRTVTWLVGAGFLAFFLAERALVLHHRDDAEHALAHSRIGALGASGLSAHSFIDGLGIGLAFQVNTSTGLLVFIAVVSHDFADGMNTVAFILRQGGSVRSAMRWLALDAAAPLFGAIVGTVVTVSELHLGYLLAVYAGFFLFMGATDLLPEAHAHPSLRRVALTVAGFVATAGVAYAASPLTELLLRELAEALAGCVVRARSAPRRRSAGRRRPLRRPRAARRRRASWCLGSRSSASIQVSVPSYSGTSFSTSNWPSRMPTRM